jgi:hypothetical protein
MKKRWYRLPLIIALILCGHNPLFSQQLTHVHLFPYFDQLPTSPEFPDSVTLISTNPDKLENHDDLNSLELTVTSAIKTESENSGVAKVSKELEASLKGGPSSAATITLKNETPAIRHAYDTLLAALRDMQAVKVEYAQNFRWLEDVYRSRVSAANESFQKLETESPCNGNSDCQAERRHMTNSTITAATRSKITGEEYLLFIYLSRVKADFQMVDNILDANKYGDEAQSKEAKTLFRGAQRDEALLLTDVIERLKLERITISNCARLAQNSR